MTRETAEQLVAIFGGDAFKTNDDCGWCVNIEKTNYTTICITNNGFELYDNTDLEEGNAPICSIFLDKPIYQPPTFEQFQASRQDCFDLGKKLKDPDLDKIPGYLYGNGSLYIEKHLEDEGCDLTIMRDSWANETLEFCEKKLYEFCVEERYTMEEIKGQK